MIRFEAIERLVNEVLRGALDAEKALDQWPSGECAGETESVLQHQLQHYEADSDIRAKDPTYTAYQEGVIRGLLAKLKAEVG